MSSASELVTIGGDILVTKYYALATCTILLYDHLLTLADEVKYIWFGRKSLGFWLFIVNRYSPIPYQLWLLTLSFFRPHFPPGACDSTGFMPSLTFAICTLTAQTVLTMRIYAVTMKNFPIAIGFAIITVFQFGLGIYVLVLSAGTTAILPPIPLEAFSLCIFTRHQRFEIAYTAISLVYDTLAFSLILFVAARSRVMKAKIPSVLGIMAQDAALYFVLIFSSHFTLVMTMTLGRESIQLLPATGNLVFLPVMISRLMLSLQKAGDAERHGWVIGGPSLNSIPVQNMRLSYGQRRTGTTVGEGDIPLNTYTGS